MSSRNRRLDPQARQASTTLVRALAAAQRAYAAGSRDLAEIGDIVIRALRSSGGVEVEYAAVVDPRAFRPAARAGADSLVVIAAQVGGVRLIDNAVLGAGDVLRFAPPPAPAPRLTAAPRPHPPTPNGVPA
jgi:pantoate--beta-alanine ligase